MDGDVEKEISELLESAGCTRLGAYWHNKFSKVGDGRAIMVRSAIREVMEFKDDVKIRSLWYKKGKVLFIAVGQGENDGGEEA